MKVGLQAQQIFRVCYLVIVLSNVIPPLTSTSYNNTHRTGIEFCPGFHLCDEEDSDDRCGNPPIREKECGCDAACEYFGDCCYDYWSACRHTSEPTYTETVSRKYECLEDGIYAIAFCRVNSSVGTSTIDKCEHPDSGDALLEVIVSDKEYNIYKNIFCALCNDVAITNITAWEMFFFCIDEVFSSEFNQSFFINSSSGTDSSQTSIYEELLSNDQLCPYVSFNPPSGTKNKGRPCAPKSRSQCNNNYVNETVISPCFKSIVYASGNVYFNQHYAICNNMSHYACNPDSDEMFRTTDRRLSDITFIIDFTGENSIPADLPYVSYSNMEVSCSTGVFDPFTNQCIELTCKDGFKLEGSRCIGRSTSSDCSSITVSIPKNIFCECNIEEQSLHIEYEYKNENGTGWNGTVDVFKSRLALLGINYTTEYSNCKSNKTITIISVEKIKCQVVYEVHGVLNSVMDDDIDTQLGVVTFRQNCSIKTIENKLLCEPERLLLTADKALSYDNLTGTIHADNSSLKIPDEMYVLELVYQLGNESSICGILSMPTCNVCPQIQLDTAAFTDQGNGTLVYRATGTKFEEHQYTYTDSSKETLLVCSFLNTTGEAEENIDFFNYPDALLVTSVVGTLISLVGLFITILLRVVIAELRTLFGKMILNLSIALFIALLLTLFQDSFIKWTTLCKAVAAVLQYMWLVCFCWMNSMAIELFITFGMIQGSSRSPRSKKSQRKSFIRYFIYSWGLPAIYVTVIFGLSLCECTSINVKYGDDTVCWIRDELASLYVFGIPTAVILMPNIVLFLATVKEIRKTIQSTAAVQSSKSDQNQRKEMIIYIRISTIMGLTWVFGYLASFIDHVVLWYIFTILNSLQGFFIFVAFNMNHSIKKVIKSRKKIIKK
ncbi:uncharacterized protein [Antedon mediterranea]|uniref:uncharacterized protein n=1 Tax=Antedon mediterranea TaxID=105859 RepID=UPI003AF9FBE9